MSGRSGNIGVAHGPQILEGDNLIIMEAILGYLRD